MRRCEGDKVGDRGMQAEQIFERGSRKHVGDKQKRVSPNHVLAWFVELHMRSRHMRKKRGVFLG